MTSRFGLVEALGNGPQLDGFDCGSAPQTTWLIDHALPAHQSGSSRVYVVTDTGTERRRVVGYYALAAGSVAPAQVPQRLTRGAGRYQQPVVILTRLGVDLSVQGERLGPALVVDALRRVAVAAEVIGVRAMLIHCENEPARDFYLRLAKFDPSPTDPLHLFLLVKDLRQAISGGSPAGSPRRETGTRAGGRDVPASGSVAPWVRGRRAARWYP